MRLVEFMQHKATILPCLTMSGKLQPHKGIGDAADPAKVCSLRVFREKGGVVRLVDRICLLVKIMFCRTMCQEHQRHKQSGGFARSAS